MSSYKWGLIVIAGALIGIAIGFTWATNGSRGAVATSAPLVSAGALPTRKPRRVLYYHDAMRPEVKFDQPGKSPFMDMQLVPVYADDGADAGGVAVSSNARQSLGIRIGRVERAAIAPRVSAVGSVSYDEHDIALVQARVTGYVNHLHVRAVLDRVHQGQVLADVVAPAWIGAEGEYVALLNAGSSDNPALLAATRQGLVVIGVPEETILEIEKTHSVPTSAALRAPISGVITELNLRDGASFEAGVVLFRINGTGTVWVNAQLPEADANMVAAGALVEIRATARPGEVFKGRVQSILPQLDPATRTVGVRVAIRNSADKLIPGMFVQVTLAGEARASQLWVPSEAVIVTGERSVVIGHGNDGRFDVVNVTPGAETGGKTAILTGLVEGQAIVLSGQFLIDSEASLRSAINRLTPLSNTTTGSVP